jgi:uncharacterized protein (TIGR01777 family)
MKNKIVIAGGSGFLGKCVIRKFNNSNTEIVVLGRGKKSEIRNISYVQWDAENSGEWEKELEGSTAVINLVGKSVNCRYTDKNKKEIIASRVNATSILGKAIQNCSKPPKLWINAGSAAIFGDSGTILKHEGSSVGDGFSPEVCKRWEQAFQEAETPFTRKVFLRIGLVFAKDAWVLKPFVNMAKLGIGGKIGSGEQFMTWIHVEDFLNLIDFVMKKEDISGILHCASPFPVTNKDFMKALRVSCKVPFGIPNPALLVRLGAILIGTEADLVLDGRKVVSKVLEEKQFNFKYPKIEQALKQLI